MLRGQRKERRHRTWPPLTPTPVGEARQEATREALPGSCTTLGGLRRRISLREPWMWEVAAAAAAAKSLQSSPTLLDRMDCSLSGSSIHGIFQARVLEWGAIAFSMWEVEGSLNPSGLRPCREERGVLIPISQMRTWKPWEGESCAQGPVEGQE